MKALYIQNGKIWDGEAFFHGDILIENGIITRIRTVTEENSAPLTACPDTFLYDARGKIVSPGLVDIHTHIKGISPDTFGVNGDLSCIPFGVTAAADACGTLEGEALPHLLQVKTLVFLPVPIQNNHAVFDNLNVLWEKYGDRAIGLKVFFDIHVSDVSDITPLKEICQYARSMNKIVMVHTSNSPVPMREILETLQPGDIFSHAYHGGPNNIGVDSFQAVKEAQKCGILIDAGMAGHVHTDFEVLQAALEAGVAPDIISTDITHASAYTRGGIYGLTWCMNRLRNMGMKEEAVFRAVTSSAARALGRAQEWGYLRTGRCADLTVLEDTKDGYHCLLTISNGQVVYRTISH